MSRRAAKGLVAIAAMVVPLLVTAAPASAHALGGPQPTDYRSQIESVVPSSPTVRVSLVDLGRRVRVRNAGLVPLDVVGPDGAVLRRVRARTTVTYADQRTSASAVVTSWTIPIRQGDTTITVTGSITKQP